MSSEPSLIPSPDQPSVKSTPAGAIWSLVLGILSLFCLWLLGSIPAIILGCLSIKKAKANPDTVGGEGLALAGIITGAIGIFTGLITVGIMASVALPAYMGVQGRAEEVKAMSNVRQIALATLVCSQKHPEEEFPESLYELIPEFLADESLLTMQFTDGTTSAVQYCKVTKTDSADEPMLLLKLPKQNEYILGYRDGSVEKLRPPLDPEVLKSFEP